MGASAIETIEYEALLHGPRGRRMVVGVVFRLLLAVACFVGAVLLAGVAVTQLGYATGTIGHAGQFRALDCHDDIDYQLDRYVDTECIGSLRTPDGHLVNGNLTLTFPYSPHDGEALSVRYTGSGTVIRTGTRQTLQALCLSFLTLALLSAGLVWPVHAFRRFRPTHPWCRPDTRQWKWFVRLGFLGVLGCALAGLLCWIISFCFH